MTTTRTARPAAAVIAAGLLAIAAGCGGGGSVESPGGGSSGGSAETAPGTDQATPPGPTGPADLSLSIEEVTSLTLEGELDVRGFVVDVDGATRLCSSADGATCGQPSLLLVGYDGDVPSPGEVTVTGEVSGSELVVSG